MDENLKFERRISAPDGIHQEVERNDYQQTNIIALALIGASVVAAIVGTAALAIIL